MSRPAHLGGLGPGPWGRVARRHARRARGRAVLVSGASSGIGRACALRFDATGFRVFAGVREPAAAAWLSEETGGRVTPVMLDITEPDSIREAAATVVAAGELRLAGVVNNAGRVVSGPLECVPVDSVRAQLEVNTVGHLAVTQAFAPLLRAGSGRVVNIGSVAGRFGQPFLGPYVVSKHALEGLTDCLRRELAADGVWVTIVEPGSVKTPIWERGLREAEEMLRSLPSESRDRYGERFARASATADAMTRFAMSPDKVARVVVRALLSRRPRPRYLLGVDARAQVYLPKLLPTRAADAGIAYVLHGRPRRRVTLAEE